MNIIEKLKEKVQELGERNLFGEGATEEQIVTFENTLNLKLPPIMKAFYLANNGGCFADDSWSKEDLLNPEELGSIIWNSNYFLSLEEIIDAYNSGKYGSIDFQEQEKESDKRLIPIIHTNGQENLVWDITEEGSTKIIDAFHEIGADEWDVLYDSFEDLLNDYIIEEGDIETVA